MRIQRKRYTHVFNDVGEWIGFKKNIYCYPPIGTSDGGAYSRVKDQTTSEIVN